LSGAGKLSNSSSNSFCIVVSIVLPMFFVKIKKWSQEKKDLKKLIKKHQFNKLCILKKKKQINAFILAMFVIAMRIV